MSLFFDVHLALMQPCPLSHNFTVCKYSFFISLNYGMLLPHPILEGICSIFWTMCFKVTSIEFNPPPLNCVSNFYIQMYRLQGMTASLWEVYIFLKLELLRTDKIIQLYCKLIILIPFSFQIWNLNIYLIACRNSLVFCWFS